MLEVFTLAASDRLDLRGGAQFNADYFGAMIHEALMNHR